MSKSRSAFDESEHSRVAKPADPLTFGAPSLFDPPITESSRAAGESVQPDHRLSEERTILLQLATLPPMETASRARIAAMTGIPLETCCWRLADLQKEGYVACIEKSAHSHRKASLLVNGYRISESGRQRLERAA